MKEQMQAFIAEINKNRHSRITWVTFIVFSIAPVMGGLFILLMKDNGTEGLSGAFKAKAILLSFTVNWESYLGLLSQAIGVGGVVIFGFVASWIFGREYSEGTAKDLLALPISRIKILNAKFLYYVVWCLLLALSNLLLGVFFGLCLKLPGWDLILFKNNLSIYFITTILTILLGTPVAFLAISGKGYLSPLGFVFIVLVFAQIIGAMGFGSWFPWAVPGIFSGSGGSDLKSQLNVTSYIILAATSLAGYFSTTLWWKYTDQN